MKLMKFTSLFSCRLSALLYAIMALAGCSWSLEPELRPAQDPSQSYQFTGFKLSPPSAADWYRGDSDTKHVVFYKNTSQPEAFRLTAVVTHLETSATAGADEDFTDFVERVLRRRFEGNRRLALLKLTTTTETIAQATCAVYEAWQGERYYPPIFKPRLESLHRGYVCRHPSIPHLLIQGFYTERRLMQGTAAALPIQELDEAEKLIRQIEFTPQ